MNTDTTPQPKIDLAGCKPGVIVTIRNGKKYPLEIVETAQGNEYVIGNAVVDRNGRYTGKGESPWDIISIEADPRDAEMARVLTEILGYTEYSHDGLLFLVSLQDRFRWNGEAFEAINPQQNDSTLIGKATREMKVKRELAEKLSKPEQKDELECSHRNVTKIKSDILCNHCGIKMKYDPVSGWLPDSTDPLDAPVTLRELCKHLDSYCEPTDEEDVVTLPFTNLVRHIVERSAK